VLQEIIAKIAEPGRNFAAKIQGLLYDATFGLLNDYRKKTLELARITAVSLYLQSLKELRKAAVALFLITLASVVFSVAAVVVPVAVVIVSPLTPLQKMLAILFFGVLDMGAALVFMFHLFSEENWMKITKSQEMVDKIMNTPL